jgi:hypothetical protein
VRVDHAPPQEPGAAARPAHGPDRTPDVDAALDALVRLLARQAAREHLERLVNPDTEDITDER